jgi:hypothetical protein
MKVGIRCDVAAMSRRSRRSIRIMIRHMCSTVARIQVVSIPRLETEAMYQLRTGKYPHGTARAYYLTVSTQNSTRNNRTTRQGIQTRIEYRAVQQGDDGCSIARLLEFFAKWLTISTRPWWFVRVVRSFTVKRHYGTQKAGLQIRSAEAKCNTRY